MLVLEQKLVVPNPCALDKTKEGLAVCTDALEQAQHYTYIELAWLIAVGLDPQHLFPEIPYVAYLAAKEIGKVPEVIDTCWHSYAATTKRGNGTTYEEQHAQFIAAMLKKTKPLHSECEIQHPQEVIAHYVMQFEDSLITNLKVASAEKVCMEKEKILEIGQLVHGRLSAKTIEATQRTMGFHPLIGSVVYFFLETVHREYVLQYLQ